MTSTRATSVGTLARGLDILALFGRQGPELSQTEISEALGLPLPTVHRLCAVLVERSFLERQPHTRRFRLGLELAHLMPALLSGLRLPELGRAHVSRLAAETGETVNLAVLHGREIVYLLSESGARLLTSQTPVGLRLPAHCTALGKCLLAQLPEETAHDVLGPEPYEQRTPRTRTTWSALGADLAAIRATGVAHSWDEYEIGLASVAVVVASPQGESDAALNVSMPTSRATDAVRDDLARRLRTAADRIGAGLAAAAPFR